MRRFYSLILMTAIALVVAYALLYGQQDEDAALPLMGVTRLYKMAETGHNISYVWRGDAQGAPVIFLHGDNGDAKTWLELLATAPAGVEAIAADRPGYGRTRPPGGVKSLEAQATAIATLFPDDKRRVVLVGQDMGGGVAIKAALKYPKRVKAVVILGVVPKGAAARLDLPALEAPVTLLRHKGNKPAGETAGDTLLGQPVNVRVKLLRLDGGVAALLRQDAPTLWHEILAYLPPAQS